MSSHLRDDLQRITERASEWLETLSESPGQDDRAAFAEWLCESPVHVREFLNITAVDRQLAHLDPERHLQLLTRPDALISNVTAIQDLFESQARSPEASTDERSLPAKCPQNSFPARANRFGIRWRQMVAITLGVSTIIAAASWWRQHTAWQEYSTAVGEQNTIELADGTTVSLNTSSRMKVRFTERRRDVRLQQGEALFTVHHDPIHPFRVYTDTSVIEAIGTKFDVHRRAANDVTVSVIEGEVQIAPEFPIRTAADPAIVKTPDLKAGEQVHLADGRVTSKHHDIDLVAVTAWREHRLVFHDSTLGEVAEEFNRYNVKPRIRILDEAARARRYTVILPANDPQSLIDYLRGATDLAIERRDDEVIIRKP